MASILRRAVKADVAFVNRGGVRTEFPIDEDSDKRNITLSDIYTMFPFGNKIYLYEITYGDFLNVLEYALKENGNTLLTHMEGLDCYYTDETVNAIVTSDGQEVYANGTWTEGWKDRKIRIALNEYSATTNRATPDGIENPFIKWSKSTELIENLLVDNEAAITVLTDEASANDGLLTVDQEPHFIIGEYVSSDESNESEPTVPEDEDDSSAPTETDEIEIDDSSSPTETDEIEVDDSSTADDSSDSSSQTNSSGTSGTNSSSGSSSTNTSGKSSSSSSSGTSSSGKSSASGTSSSSGSSGSSGSSSSSSAVSNPSTGDTSPVLLLITLMTVSGMLMLTFFLRVGKKF